MGLPGLPREKVVATVVHLLETTLIRIGNDEYARQNRSYGLTTLRNHHVEIDGSDVHFQFVGKSGKPWRRKMRDRRVAKIIKTCQELPGQELLQYLNDDGEPQSITSGDVNAYLKEISGEDITAKDFRTWAGTVMVAIALAEFEGFDSAAQAKRNLRAAIEQVASRLGNTPTVCRKCYVHPDVLTAYLDGTLAAGLRSGADAPPDDELQRLAAGGSRGPGAAAGIPRQGGLRRRASSHRPRRLQVVWAATERKRRRARPKNRPPMSATARNRGQTTSRPAPR